MLEDDGDDESSSDSDGESVAIAAASTAALAVRTNSSRSNASNMTDFGSEATETSDDDELTGAERPAAAAYGFDEGMLHGLAEEYGSGSEVSMRCPSRTGLFGLGLLCLEVYLVIVQMESFDR